MNSKDVLQKLAENSDDITALKILSSDYFQRVFGKRYPDLIKYNHETSIRKFYLKALNQIGRLKEEFYYIYKNGDPFLQYAILQSVENTWKGRISIQGRLNTLLERASELGSILLVEYALEKGAEIHADEDYALSMASQFGHTDIVKYLIGKGAKIDAYSNYALEIAIEKGYFDIVQLLIEKGAMITNQILELAEDNNAEIYDYLISLT